MGDVTYITADGQIGLMDTRRGLLMQKKWAK